MRHTAFIVVVALTLGATAGCSRDERAARAIALADARYRDRAAPPFPDTSSPSEVLENIRYAVWLSQRSSVGADAFYEPGAVVLQRLIEVREPRLGNYFIAEVHTKDHRMVWQFEMRKRTGSLISGGGPLPRGARSMLSFIPTLESAAPELERRFGAQGAHYFCPPYNDLGDWHPIDQPFISARSPRGTILVNIDLTVFEEIGFDVDPPGLSPEARLELLRQRAGSRHFVQTDDAVMWFQEVGRLDK